LSTNLEQSKIPPSAVALNSNFRPRILGYYEHTPTLLVNRINATLETGLGIDPATITQGFIQALSLQLASHDVLIIYPQTEISQADLESKVIPPMDDVLVPFLARGGVVLLLEGGGLNDGTYQILSEADLVSIQGRMRLARGPVAKTLEGFRDFTNGVAAPYRGENATFGFLGVDPASPSVLLYHVDSARPVVIHNIFVVMPAP